MWLALPGGQLSPGRPDDERDLLELLADETNVRAIVVIGDESELVERRVKPLLGRIGKRLGAKTQDVLAAARANEVEYLGGGGVRLAGIDLDAEDVEIIATPRSGTAVAHENGLVVVIDTELDDDLRAEGDARELSRAVQELRKQVGLELDDTIELWLSAPSTVLDPIQPFMSRVTDDTLAAQVHHADPPAEVESSVQAVSGGEVTLGLRRSGGGE